MISQQSSSSYSKYQAQVAIVAITMRTDDYHYPAISIILLILLH